MGKNEIPEGTRDLIYNQCFVRQQIIERINTLFNKWGYDEIITPTLEFYHILSNLNESFKQEEMYKFFDNKGRILALRPDMTIPIARVAASKLKDAPVPLRLRYTSQVFRVNESLVGKRNEFTDCGLELIGVSSFGADLEAIILAIESLKACNIKDFKVEIGHIGIFNDLFTKGNIQEEAREKLANLIEQKRLSELEDLLDSLDISDEDKKIFKKLPWLFGEEKVLKEGIELCESSEAKASINYLEKIYENLKQLGYGEYVSFDLGMVPRINYYSGIIFKGYVKGYGNYILYGGRYDELLKKYGRDLPAIGFSINVDGLCEGVNDEDFTKGNEKIIINYGKDNFIEALNKAEKMRAQGFRVELIAD